MSQLVVLYFGDRKDDDEFFTKLDINDEVKAGNVVCFRVPEPAEKSPATASVVPVDRLASEDLWTSYGIEKADTFVVTDRFGNPYHTGTDAALLAKLNEVNKHFRGVRKELKKSVETARKAREKGEIAAALKSLKEAFEHKLVGYNEAIDAEKLYGDLIKEGREKLKGADAATLEKLAKVYSGTEIESEALEAMKAAKSGSN